MGVEKVTSLLLIGAAGLDWPGLAARREGLPHLSALAARGTSGWLTSPAPRQGPAAWTTLATGALPEAHRVIRTEEPWSGGLRPLTHAGWRQSPVWARLAAAGVSTGSVGWPGARPGDTVPGLHIDEDFAEPTGLDPEAWALPRHCAPADVREALRDLRTHPADITADMLAPLVPTLGALDQRRDGGLPRLALAMARAATVQAAAAWMLESRRPQTLFVHLGWLGEVRDSFEGATEGPFAQAVDGAWRFLDALIGRLADLAGPEALVLVASPGRRSNPGALIAAGPGATAGQRFTKADALDVAPTILNAFGFAAPDLTGHVLLAPNSWTVPRPLAPLAIIPPPTADTALLQTAAEAGYRPPNPVGPGWRAQALAELAAAVIERDPRAAANLADEALAFAPDHVLALGMKAMAHAQLEEAAPLGEAAEALMRVAPESGWGPLAHAVRYLIAGPVDAAIPWLRRAEVDKRPELRLRIATIWIAAGRPAEAERLYKAVLKVTPQEAPAHQGLAMAALARRNFRGAEEALREALRLDPGRPSAHLQLAQVYALTARPADAARASAAAITLGADPAQAAAAREGRLGI